MPATPVSWFNGKVPEWYELVNTGDSFLPEGAGECLGLYRLKTGQHVWQHQMHHGVRLVFAGEKWAVLAEAGTLAAHPPGDASPHGMLLFGQLELRDPS
eukprot:6201444-Pleurochrysis_carterae.AAC.1